MIRESGGIDRDGRTSAAGNVDAVLLPAERSPGGIGERHGKGGAAAFIDCDRRGLRGDDRGAAGRGTEPCVVVSGDRGFRERIGVEGDFIKAAREGFLSARSGGSDDGGKVETAAERLGDGTERSAVVIERGLTAGDDDGEVHEAADAARGQRPCGSGRSIEEPDAAPGGIGMEAEAGPASGVVADGDEAGVVGGRGALIDPHFNSAVAIGEVPERVFADADPARAVRAQAFHTDGAAERAVVCGIAVNGAAEGRIPDIADGGRRAAIDRKIGEQGRFRLDSAGIISTAGSRAA